MKLVKITDRLYCLPCINELDRPNLYYLLGTGMSVAIDAGQSKENVQQFYEAIKKEGFPLPEYTIITHWHWDHSFGIPFVAGKTIASELTQKQLQIVKNWEWTKPAMAQRVKDGLDLGAVVRFINKVFPNLNEIKVDTADIAISKPMELDLGDIHVQIFPHDSIHSRDALIVYCQEEKAVFAGDADCPDYYNKGEILSERVKSYKVFIESLDFETYYIGHDLPDNREEILSRLDKMIL